MPVRQVLPRVPGVVGEREGERQRRAERAVRGRRLQEVAALPPLPLLRHLPPQLRQRDHEQEGRHRHSKDAGRSCEICFSKRKLIQF